MVNIPNLLSAFRLVGSVVLLGLAVLQVRTGFVWLLGALLVSDWIDGKLAIALKQQTTFGARLDSVADASMYAAMLFGFVRLYPEIIRQEWPWMVAAVVSYGVTSLFGFLKYRRFPSYHTRSAKTGWLLVSLAAIAVFGANLIWPIRVVAVFVVLTNLEATAMTMLLRHWHADVPSIWHAWRIRQTEQRIESTRAPVSNGAAIGKTPSNSN